MALKYDRNKLEELCLKFNLSLVIVYGSYAKGRITLLSDIDVGFLGEQNVINREYFAILSALSDLFGDKLDPLCLNGAEAMIAYQAAKDGLPLYEKTKGLFNAFKVSAIARYLDTKKFRLLEKEYLKSSIQKGA